MLTAERIAKANSEMSPMREATSLSDASASVSNRAPKVSRHQARWAIDEAATHANRSPQDVRRLLNLGEPLPVEQIAEFALHDGISVFTVDARDPHSIHTLAKETSPAVKEMVAKERHADGDRHSRRHGSGP